MTKVLGIFYLVIILLINITTSNAKIVFFDIDKAMMTSKPGVSILKQLNKLNENNLEAFQNTKKTLQKKESKIISQKNIISNEEFEDKISKLRIEINNFNEDRKKTLENFNKLRIDNSNKLLNQLTRLITKYSEEKSISMILKKKNVIVGKSDLDITNEIIEIINNSIKEFKIK